MRLGGDVVQQLPFVEQCRHGHLPPHASQRPVVRAATLAEPQPAGPDRESRDEHQAGRPDRVVPQACTDRLEQAATAVDGARSQGVRPGVGSPIEVEVGLQDGQEHGGPARREGVQERSSCGLGGPGDVRGHSVDAYQLLHRQHVLGQLRGRAGTVLDRPRAPCGAQSGTQLALGGIGGRHGTIIDPVPGTNL